MKEGVYLKKHTVFFALSAVLAFIFVSSSIMTTYSMWSVQNDTINAVSMGSVKVSLEEEYEQGQELMPGATADKKVWAKNTGLLDIVVRMQITRKWGTEGPDGTIIEDKSLSTDNIEILWNQTDWYYNADDDYYYYKGVLGPGEVTTPLMEHFTLRADTGNEYKNKFANIIVTVECVQAQGGGISFWDMSFEDLGITYHEPEPLNIITRVNFLGPATGFDFPDNQGDLFAEFKLLAPGESRSQTVEVKNTWNKPVEIFLWADVTEQHPTMRDSLALVDELLKDYSALSITAADGLQIYRGAVWGNPTRDSRAGDSMHYPYSLGIFQPGQTKTLQLGLTLDPRMDNRFHDLFGLIDWWFSASGDDDMPTTTAAPTTTSGPTTTGSGTTASPTTTLPPPPVTSTTDPSTGTRPPDRTGPTVPTAPASVTNPPTATIKPPIGDIPKTGNNENKVTFWASMSTASGAFLVGSLLALKRQKKDEEYA